MYYILNFMTIKQATEKVFNEINEDMSRVEIISRIQKLTGYTKDSIIGNVFRQVDYIPWIRTDFIEFKKNNLIHYKRGASTYKQNFNKPEGYFDALLLLNSSDRIYTLCGTESNCLRALDRTKTITVDSSPFTNPDVRGDIFRIKKHDFSSYNLDFEGILTQSKIDEINKLKADKIVLTFRSSKNDELLKKLNYKRTKRCIYKSGRCLMKIYLLENKKTLTS